MNVLQRISGCITITVTCADIPSLLKKLSEKLSVQDIQWIDLLSIHLKVMRKDWPIAKRILQQCGCDWKIQTYQGGYWYLRASIKRPILLIGVLIMLIAVVYLPGRIFFVRVEGNVSLPEKYILDHAAECGIRIGTHRRVVRSEKMKNSLLESIPQLQWAGVNTSGCVAIISVKERNQEEYRETTNSVGSIIAARDGIITSMTVLRGSPRCQIGEAVKAGQVLVSGYTDCGISIQATRAEAEIEAQTARSIELISPVIYTQRAEEVSREKKYSLLIGKKLINFYIDSGISSPTCVKMYSADYMTLPGGFQLPIALITEECIYYRLFESAFPEKGSFDWMQNAARQYLISRMSAGEILSENGYIERLDDICYYYGEYSCREMISQLRNEERMYEHGKDSGEDG